MSGRAWPAGRRFARRHWRRTLALTSVALVLAFIGGFVRFAMLIASPAPDPGYADGIAALTGGADRVRAGFKLLEEGRAPSLLVTGIGGHAGLAALAREAGVEPGPLADRVTLGRGATSTRGNAAEIAAWARARHAASLIVVTANYHMPRALTEIGRALPGVRLEPAPVPTPAGVRLLISEYLKLLAARLGLTTLLPADAPRLIAGTQEAAR
ncbi:MAG TPA: YdcF family protein [Acetobacteraceae bacterium]|nr:YdcF family protein [Acetobacteraceae bacterium]